MKYRGLVISEKANIVSLLVRLRVEIFPVPIIAIAGLVSLLVRLRVEIA